MAALTHTEPRPFRRAEASSRAAHWFAGIAAALLALGTAILVIAGYFGRDPYRWYPAAVHGQAQSGMRPPLVAVYWSGDMGMALGNGRPIVRRLNALGVPVLVVTSPTLFATARDRGFVDSAVAASIRKALTVSGAQKVAVIGGSFGADIVGTGLGRLPPDLRAKVSSAVLLVPETEVYFHADPFRLAYSGPVSADPEHTVPLLRGLPLTCIYGTEETHSLCPQPFLRTARRVAIPDGHMMIWRHADSVQAVADAVLSPPAPFGGSR